MQHGNNNPAMTTHIVKEAPLQICKILSFTLLPHVREEEREGREGGLFTFGIAEKMYDEA